jgi:hypothetical protein
MSWISGGEAGCATTMCKGLISLMLGSVERKGGSSIYPTMCDSSFLVLVLVISEVGRQSCVLGFTVYISTTTIRITSCDRIIGTVLFIYLFILISFKVFHP